MDYMGKQRKEGESQESEDKEWGGGEGSNPIIVEKGRESKYIMANVHHPKLFCLFSNIF